MMYLTDKLLRKEKTAVKLLQNIPSDDIELCYSGGKDSDVILYLARLAGINFTPIYKCTTIDPPGTIKHCEDRGAVILRPHKTFFDLIEDRGFPTRRARFCCQVLKEYKVKDHAILGIRRAESRKRNKRYKEPQICRLYGKGEHVCQYLPILEWTDRDMKEYIVENNIDIHPLYYNDCGQLDCSKRLGCLGCPEASDNGVADFRQYPILLKQWLKHGEIWWKSHAQTQSHKKFSSIYALMCHNLFFKKYADFLPYDNAGLFSARENWKALLEDYFKIDL